MVLEQHLRAGYFAGAATAIIGNPVPPPPGASTAPRLGQPLRFGYIGRLVPEKGLELLADAFAPVRGAWSLLIAGRGEAEYETRLRQRLEPLGAEFRGWMQADDFYSTVDVVLVPSLWREPFGRSVVEAWQHGRPVIVASGGGPEEIVRPEVTGWIAPPDAAAWQTWLQALVDRPEMARDLADACRRESEAFTSEHIAAAYERVYEESRRHRDAGVTPR